MRIARLGIFGWLALVAACSDQTFTTNVELSLQVIAVTPSGSSEGVPVDAVVSVGFNQEVVPESISAATVLLDDVTDASAPLPVPATLAYEPGDTAASRAPVLRVTPTDPAGERAELGYSHLYRLTLTTGLERQGPPAGTLVADVTSEFRVIDPPPLYVLARTPGPDDRQVARDTAAATSSCPTGSSLQRVVFSEGVVASQVDVDGDGAWTAADRDAAEPSALSVVDADTGVPVDATVSLASETGGPCVEDAPCVFDVVPSSPYCRFGYSQAVRVTLDASLSSLRACRVTDADGEVRIRGTIGEDKDFTDPPVHQDLAWAYRLEDPPAFGLLDRLPSADATGVPLDAAVALVFTDGLARAGLDGDGTPDTGDVVVEYTDACTPAEYPGSCPGFAPLGGSFSATTLLGDAPVESDPPDNPGLAGDDLRLVFTPASPLVESRVVRVTVRAATASDRATLVTDASSATRVSGTLGDDHDFGAAPEGGDVVWTFRAEDPPPLTVVGSLPGNGADGVPTASDVRVFFSEDLDCASVTSASFAVFDTVNAPGTNLCPVAADLCASPAASIVLGGNRVQLVDTDASGGFDAVLCDPQPSLAAGGSPTDLPYSADVSVELGAGPDGIRSARASAFGGFLAAPPDPRVLRFSVVDRPALLVLAATPSHGQQGVARDVAVVARLDRGVDPATVSASSFPLEKLTGFGGAVVETVSAHAGVSTTVVANDTLTLTPTALLDFDGYYRYTLRPTLCEPKLATETGGCLLEPYVAEFQVRGIDALAVLDTDPPDGTLGVPLGQTLVVTFNREIDPASLGDVAGSAPSDWLVFLALTRTIDPAKALQLAAVGDCTALGGGVSTEGGHFCVNGPNVTFVPDLTADALDNLTALPGADGKPDWLHAGSYSLVALPGVRDTSVPSSALESVAVASFVTQLSGLVQRMYLEPRGSVLGDFVVEFTEPVAATLGNGLDLSIPVVAEGALWVDAIDRFGVPVRLPTTVSFETATGESCTLGTSCRRARLSPAPSRVDCATTDRSLAYDTTYGVHTSSLLRAADLDPPSDPNDGTSPAEVSTSAPPRVTAASTSNDVTLCTLGASTSCSREDAEGPRVPVDSRIVLELSADMLPSSFVVSAGPAVPADNDTDTVILWRPDAGCTVALEASYDTADRKLTLTPVPGGTCPNGIVDSACAFDASGLFALEYDARYELVVRGRDAANPAPATDPCDPAVTPPNDGAYLEACTADGQYLDGNTVLSFRTSEPNSVVLSPSPAGQAQACDAFIVAQFDRLVDFDSVSFDSFVVEKRPGETPTLLVPWTGTFSRSGNDVMMMSVPAFCDTQSTNDQVTETVTPLVRDHLGNPFPSDVCRTWSTENVGNTEPITLSAVPAGGAILGHQMLGICWGGSRQDRIEPMSVSPTSLPIVDVTTAAQHPVRYDTFKDNSSATRGDYTYGQAAIEAGGGTEVSYFLAGRQYRMSVVPFGVSNLYRRSVQASPVPACLNGCTYTGETNPPTVLAGSRWPPPGATEVSPLTTVSITFSEPVHPSSVVTGRWRLEQRASLDAASRVLVVEGGAPTGFATVLGPDGSPVEGHFRLENTSAGASNANSMPGCGVADTPYTNPVAFDRVVFVPAAPLVTGTYAVRLVDGADAGCPVYSTTAPRSPGEPFRAVSDTAGNCLADSPDNEWTFTVDATAPTLASRLPTDLSPSPDLDVAGVVSYLFDEPLDVSLPAPAVLETTVTGRAVGACGADAPVNGCVRLGTAGVENRACVAAHSCDTVLFQAADPLGLPTSPALEIDLDDVQTADLAGNPFADPTDLDPVGPIEVGDTVGPRVLCTTPADDPSCGSPVAAPAAIVLTFDDAVTVGAADLWLEDATTGAPVPVSVSASGSMVTVTPDTPLAAATCYRLTVATTVTDDEGMTLLAPAHLSFETL